MQPTRLLRRALWPGLRGFATGGKTPQASPSGKTPATPSGTGAKPSKSQGTGAATGAATTSPVSAAWLLHPQVPVDVRLLGGGLLGAALLSYFASSGTAKDQKPSGATEQLQDPYAAPETTEQLQEPSAEAAPGQGTDAGRGREGVLREPMPDRADVSEQGGAQQQGEEQRQGGGAAAAAADEAVAEEPAALQRGSGGEEEEEVTEAIKAQAAQVMRVLEGALHSVGVEDVPLAPAPEDAARGETEVERIATFEQLRAQVEADGAQGSSGHFPGQLRSQGTLDLLRAATPAALIAAANARGMGPGPDWRQFAARHRQAEADALQLRALLAQAEATAQALVAAAEGAAQAEREHAQALQAVAARQQAAFEAALVAQREVVEARRQAELALAAERAQAAQAAAVDAERVAASAALDEVRLRVDALAAAFVRRSDQQRAGASAHVLSGAAAGLRDALAAGVGYGRPLAALAASIDPVATAVAASLPGGVRAAQGVPTPVQLQDSFRDVARAGGELALLPPGSHGVAARLLAKAAARIKVGERAAPPRDASGAGISSALAAAEASLVAGKYLAAAEHVQAGAAGTAAEQEVAGWVSDVRSRVAAEQAAQLLQARANCLAASLA